MNWDRIKTAHPLRNLHWAVAEVCSYLLFTIAIHSSSSGSDGMKAKVAMILAIGAAAAAATRWTGRITQPTGVTMFINVGILATVCMVAALVCLALGWTSVTAVLAAIAVGMMIGLFLVATKGDSKKELTIIDRVED